MFLWHVELRLCVLQCICLCVWRVGLRLRGWSLLGYGWRVHVCRARETNGNAKIDKKIKNYTKERTTTSYPCNSLHAAIYDMHNWYTTELKALAEIHQDQHRGTGETRATGRIGHFYSTGAAHRLRAGVLNRPPWFWKHKRCERTNRAAGDYRTRM